MFGFVNTSIVIREAGEERTTVAVTTIKGPVPRRLSLRVFIIDVTASLGKLSPLIKVYRLLLNFLVTGLRFFSTASRLAACCINEEV